MDFAVPEQWQRWHLEARRMHGLALAPFRGKEKGYADD
jgi:hypothetical protein